MIDDQKLSEARADIPFLKNGIYVDNASVTPMSERVRRASDRFNALTSEQLRQSKAIATTTYDKGRALAAMPRAARCVPRLVPPTMQPWPRDYSLTT